MNQNEFLRQQQAAIERMREMNSRSALHGNTNHKMPPAPSFVKLNENSVRSNHPKNPTHPPIQPSTPRPECEKKPVLEPFKHRDNNLFSGLNIPFLDKLKDGDSALLIGLLLILISENADKRLLFALLYIML